MNRKIIKKYRVLIFIIIGIISSMLNSCKEEITPSLYDLADKKGSAPVISSVEPSGVALAGVSEVTINGSNFSSKPEFNIVLFNGVSAVVKSASGSKLTVLAPNLISDTVKIKMAVSGSSAAVAFSNIVNYKLIPAVSNVFPPENSILLPYALTVDAQENLYISVTSGGKGDGIKKFSPDGILTDFAPKGGETFFSSIKMGPGNTIYAVRRVKAIFVVTEGTASKTWVTNANGLGSINDFDFDQNKNIWAGGSGNGKIYRITQAKELKAFSFPEDINAIRVFDNNLYIGSTDGTNETLWKIEIISADSLGTPQKFFDFSAIFQGLVIKALDASNAGDIFIGTNTPQVIIILHQDKTFEQLYPDLIESAPVYAFGSGNGVNLFYTREAVNNDTLDISRAIIKVNIQKQIAHNYGIE